MNYSINLNIGGYTINTHKCKTNGCQNQAWGEDSYCNKCKLNNYFNKQKELNNKSNIKRGDKKSNGK